MKKILLVLAVALISLTSFGQLNDNAKTIKKALPTAYDDVKTMSVLKWGDDHSMVVYRINAQCDAMMKVGSIVNSDSYDETLYNSAAAKWSENINGKFYFDWAMIVYNYNNQLEAKSQY